MSIAAFADKSAAIFRRDLLTALRYRSAFALTVAGALTELAAFYYLSRAIGPGFRPEGLDYFSFLLVGTGFYTFLVMGIHSFLQTVQEAQQTGTFEVLMTTSTPPAVLVLLSAMSAFSRNAVQLLFYLAAGLLIFNGTLPRPSIAACLLILVLSVVIAMAIGLMVAALQVAIQKGSVVLWALGSGAWLLTGTLFPVASLPRGLRLAADLIPITHALDAMRMALLQGAGFPTLGHEIRILSFFAFALFPLSLLMFSHSLRRARQEGTLSSY
jgi:ABC-2 type transport system permease protein